MAVAVAVGRKKGKEREPPGAKGEARRVQNWTKPVQNSFFSRLPPTRALLGWCSVSRRVEWAPLRCTTRGKLARDEGLLRYVAGFFMRREYKETERACRSRGARGARKQR